MDLDRLQFWTYTDAWVLVDALLKLYRLSSQLLELIKAGREVVVDYANELALVFTHCH